MKILSFSKEALRMLAYHLVTLCLFEHRSAALALVTKSSLSAEDVGSMDTQSGKEGLAWHPYSSIARAAAAHMSLETALQVVKPPHGVLQLLHKVNITSNHGSIPGFAGAPDVSDSEVMEAVTALNALAANAQQRLDARSLECKGYDEYYHELIENLQLEGHLLTRQQVSAETRFSSARTSLAAVDTQRQITKERQHEQQKVFNRSISSKLDRLDKMRDSLKISEFMLDMTKCDATLLGVARNLTSSDLLGKGLARQYRTTKSFRLCRTSGSEANIEFEDVKLQNLTSRLTSDGRWQLFLALTQSRMSLQSVFADSRIPDMPEDGGEVNLLRKPISTHQPPFDAQKAGKCAFDIELSCGEAHDAFASLWGDMKDSVDGLEAEVATAESQKRAFGASTQHELEAIGGNEAMLKADLVDISMLMAELEGQLANKARETDELQQFAAKSQLECTSTIHEIVFLEMCGVFKIRSELLAQAQQTDSPTDCEVSEWRKSGRCSKRCDGGKQVWKRKITKNGSPSGVGCPLLQTESSCNDRGCPIDCKLAAWTAWSNCSNICGGGIRYRTRSREVNPKYGGFECDVMQETQQCSTQACDKNCKLGEWSAFSACSQACDAGFLQRRRPVLQLAIGSGTCPEKDSSERLDREDCNKQACVGDEECISKLDVILAIDGSGSITEKGFTILRTFGAKFVKRLRGGSNAVRVGLVQFGNGVLDSEDVISDAIAVKPLSENINEVSDAVSNLQWQKGFTNMAQAAMKSRDLLRIVSQRNGSQTLVLFITDGRPSFKTMATRAMQELRESARVMIVQVKSYPERHNMELLKGFATEPVEANYLHIAGKKVLQLGYDEFVSKVIVQACQNVESPSATAEAAKQAKIEAGASQS